MTNEDKLKHAQQQWSDAVKNNDFYRLMYWNGYMDGLKTKIFKEIHENKERQNESIKSI